METKNLEFGQEARVKMMAGVKKLARAVKATLGPRGRNVVIQKHHQSPHITKDGVTVATQVLPFKDPYENMGAQIVKEAASKTADLAGDGTTSSTVLAEAILTEGMRLVAADHDPMSLKRGIDKVTVKLVEQLKKQSKQVSDTKEIKQVAVISANGDENIGSIIAEAMDKVGKNGIVTLEEGKGRESSLKVTSGFEFDRGFLNINFCNELEKQRVVLENPKVWLINGPVSTENQMSDMMPTLEHCHKNDIPLVIIADNMEGAVLATLIVNKLRGTLRVVAVRAPGFGATKQELLSDISVLTGANLRNPSAGDEVLQGVTPDELGTARRVIVTKETTVIVGNDGREEFIEQRAKEIRGLLEGETSAWDRERTESRLAKLLGGAAIIEVGAATEIEMKELKDRFDDSLAATRAAVQEGVVPGGGVALVRAADALKNFTTGNPEEDAGVRLVLLAASAPLRQIAVNAGQNGEVVLNQVLANSSPTVGYDAAAQKISDMFEAGILDPTKVVRVALENAVSVASIFLCTEAAISIEVEDRAQTGSHQGF